MAGIKTRQLTRLNKFLAANTSLSRRKADEAVLSGRVKINELLVDSPAVSVDPIHDKIFLDGKAVNIEQKYYMLFYKPVAVLTSYKKDNNKKCLSDFDFLVKRKPAYSGRLDYNSEGLIILSNDGDFLQKLQKPAFKIPKEYTVFTDKMLDFKCIQKLENGIIMNGIKYKPCKINVLGEKKYQIVLYEGKNRQIRNMMNYCGTHVKKLIRTKIGNIGIGDLAPGKFRYLSKNEIKGLVNVQSKSNR
jgi:23S rRNA pseudouridine2605 synthase/23S rRNA pseudouridine2604 synthase